MSELCDETKHLYQNLGREFGVPSTIMPFSREKSVVKIRVLVCHALRTHGFSNSMIGRLLNLNHSSVAHLLDKDIDKTTQAYSKVKHNVEDSFRVQIDLNK